MFNPTKQSKMKTATSILRIAVIIILGTLGLILLFGEEQDETALTFALHFLADKAMAVSLIALAIFFYCRWRKSDSIIKRYHDFCMMGED